MLRCVFTSKRIKRCNYSQRTKPSTSYSVCWVVGTSGSVVPLPVLPSDICLPLHLSLPPPHSMQTLISTSCAQWNDLPEATWQDMNSAGPPPASCSLLIRRRCAGVLVAGLSFPVLFPTSHASFPLPQAIPIAWCWGLRNMYATTQAWTPFWGTFEVVGWGSGAGQRVKRLSTFLGNKQC